MIRGRNPVSSTSGNMAASLRIGIMCLPALVFVTVLVLSGCSRSDDQDDSGFASATRGKEIGQVAFEDQTYVLVQYGRELAVFVEAGSPVTSRDTAEKVLISYVWDQSSTQSALTSLEAVASRTAQIDSLIGNARRVTNSVIGVFDELDSIGASVPFVGWVSAMDVVKNAYPGVDAGEAMIQGLDDEFNHWGVNSSALSQANARLNSLAGPVEVEADEIVRTFGSVEESAGNLSDTVGKIRSVGQESLGVAQDLRSGLQEASDTPVIGGSIRSLASPVGEFGGLLSELIAALSDYQGELSEVQGQFSATRSSYDDHLRSWTAKPYDTAWPPTAAGDASQEEPRSTSVPGGSERGRSVPDTSASTNEVLKYWSIPALLIVSVLTVTAMARSIWRAWQPPMIAIMCLGSLAILNDAAAVVFGYTTVNSEVLTPLAIISFPVICLLGWIILNPEQFPSINGVSAGATVTGAPIVPAQPYSPPPPAPASVTAIGGPSAPVAAAVPTPSQTMAMQPDVARSLAWLVVTRGPSEGKSLQLREGNNTIGRSLDNDLHIDDASVSRSHAMLSVRDDQFTLVDLGSASGTRIGDHRISGRQVGAGSAIVIGQTRLSLVSVDAFQGGPSSGATMVGSPSGSSLSLVAQSGPDAGKSFLLTSAQNIIGRDPSAQVVLSDPTVSRRHAMLRVDADRTTLSDLGSQSGTQFDGEIIAGVRVSIGDRVAVGQSEFTLMRPSG